MEQVWRQAQEEMRKRVSGIEYRKWVAIISPIEWHNGTVRILVQDGEFQSWFAQKYEELLEQVLESILEKPISVEYKLKNPELFESKDLVRKEVSESNLVPHYTFENFVVGPSNHMARAAGVAVANSPGRSYNPLFVYGGTGLGKTHLLHAIGNQAARNHPRLRVLYITSETYVNDLMSGIRQNRMDHFRSKYRDFCDLLLVDDIQFLANKERTQLEFFHTFNALHAAGKQVVFTSDRDPHELSDIEDRLKSRFEWGLIADIKQPELETRVAILRHKAESRYGMEVPNDVAMYLAEKIKDNIRELESCLNRLHLELQGPHFEMTLEGVTESFDSYFKRQTRRVTVEQVQKSVAHRFSVTVPELLSPSRKKNIALPRHIAMYLARKLTLVSFPEIGERFGGRDHSSVMAACKKIEKNMKVDHKLHQAVTELQQRIKR